MPEIEENEDSDVEGDSEHTDKSSSTESVGSDSEDTSDMDEPECERRRSECISDMADLEKQFELLTEQLYQERITQIDAKLEEVRSGRASEYLEPLEELQHQLCLRTEVAGILRDMRLVNIAHMHEAEYLASQQNFESQKNILWDSTCSELEEHIRRLEEDRRQVDITSDLWEQRHMQHRKRSAVTSPERRKKPVTITGPYIVYMLNEEDLLEDWTTIRKVLASNRQQNCKQIRQ